MSVITYIALGSNLNDPVQQIQQAFLALSMIPKTRLLAHSRLYLTEPFGFKEQPDFINAVAKLETSLSAEALLLACQSIENQQGRQRDRRWGPRTLDLDLLLYGEETFDLPTLTIPHPELTKRAFVLYPLVEIATDLKLPNGTDLSSFMKNHADKKPCVLL